MRISIITLLFALSLSAQSSDPSGHWEGTITTPHMEVGIQTDLAKDAGGRFIGTFSNPAQNVKGLPLADVAVNGRTIQFALKTTGGGAFQGQLSADGKTIAGDFTTQGVPLPFKLTRTGAAVIEAAPKSPAIAKDLEGAWSGTLQADGQEKRIGLKLSNQSDGTSTGTVISNEGMEIPITTITQKGPSVHLDVKSVGGAYDGELKGDALTGTWTQGPFVAPIVFHRQGATSELSIGGRAPRFALPNAVDGKTVQFTPCDGRVAVVMFLCNQCPYARAFEPRIVELAKQYQARGVAFYAIDSNDEAKNPIESIAEMKARATGKEWPFPYLKDTDSAIAHAFGARVTPHVFVIDSRGALRYRGFVDDSAKPGERHETGLANALEEVLAGKTVSKESTAPFGCAITFKS